MEEYKLKYIYDYVEKVLGGDVDLIDVESEVDMSLSYRENLEHIKEIVGRLKEEDYTDCVDLEGMEKECEEGMRNYVCGERSINLTEDITYSLEDFVSKTLYVAGSRGSGKSNYLGYVIEQIIAFEDVPVFVLDSEGDHRFIEGDNVKHVKVGVDTVDKVVGLFYESGKSFIVDVSGLHKKELKEVVATISRDFNRIGFKEKKPVYFSIDEAERFLEQGSAVPEYVDLVSRGRKRGIGMLCGFHRLARVSKDVIGEFEVALFRRFSLDIDIKRILDYISQFKDISKEDKKDIGKRILTLKTNEALFVDSLGNFGFEYIPKRKFKHGGNKPELVSPNLHIKGIKGVSTCENESRGSVMERIGNVFKHKTSKGGIERTDLKDVKKRNYRCIEFDLLTFAEGLLIMSVLAFMMYSEWWISFVIGMLFFWIINRLWDNKKEKIKKEGVKRKE